MATFALSLMKDRVEILMWIIYEIFYVKKLLSSSQLSSGEKIIPASHCTVLTDQPDQRGGAVQLCVATVLTLNHLYELSC